jgi:RimJ/RimL family protein N-acetyltransferase
METLWIGQRVRLRAFRPDNYLQFQPTADDSELDRLSWETTYPADFEQKRRRMEKEIADDKEEEDDNRLLAIETRDGRFVGTIGLHAADPRHHTADINIGLHDRAAWGQGYASEAIRLLLRFAFRELGYAKINLDVYEFNPRAIALYERLGFQHEGRIRSTIYTQGRRWDEFLMGMTRAEYDARHATWFPDAADE